MRIHPLNKFLIKSFQPCSIGECVPYYLCANGSIITSGEGILDGKAKWNLQEREK